MPKRFCIIESENEDEYICETTDNYVNIGYRPSRYCVHAFWGLLLVCGWFVVVRFPNPYTGSNEPSRKKAVSIVKIFPWGCGARRIVDDTVS